jgi:hypothetical protein
MSLNRFVVPRVAPMLDVLELEELAGVVEEADADVP